jgi:hypothetical protein
VRYGVPSKNQIATALDKQSKAAAAERAKAKAEKAGTIVVGSKQLANGTAALCAADTISNGLGTVHVLAMTADDHDGSPCGAVAVFPSREAGEQVLAACIEPSAHKDIAVVKVSGMWSPISVDGVKNQLRRNADHAAAEKAVAARPSAADIERERHDMFDRFAAASKPRRTAVAKMIKTPGRGEQLPLLHIGLVSAVGDGARPHTSTIACDLLGLGNVKDHEAGDVLNDLLLESSKDVARVATALAAAVIEAVCSAPHDRGTNSATSRHRTTGTASTSSTAGRSPSTSRGSQLAVTSSAKSKPKS